MDRELFDLSDEAGFRLLIQQLRVAAEVTPVSDAKNVFLANPPHGTIPNAKLPVVAPYNLDIKALGITNSDFVGKGPGALAGGTNIALDDVQKAIVKIYRSNFNTNPPIGTFLQAIQKLDSAGLTEDQIIAIIFGKNTEQELQFIVDNAVKIKTKIGELFTNASATGADAGDQDELMDVIRLMSIDDLRLFIDDTPLGNTAAVPLLPGQYLGNNRDHPFNSAGTQARRNVLLGKVLDRHTAIRAIDAIPLFNHKSDCGDESTVALGIILSKIPNDIIVAEGLVETVYSKIDKIEGILLRDSDDYTTDQEHYKYYIRKAQIIASLYTEVRRNSLRDALTELNSLIDLFSDRKISPVVIQGLKFEDIVKNTLNTINVPLRVVGGDIKPGVVKTANTKRIEIINNILTRAGAARDIDGIGDGEQIGAITAAKAVQVAPIIFRLTDEALVTPQVVNSIIASAEDIDHILDPLINNPEEYNRVANLIAEAYERIRQTGLKVNLTSFMSLLAQEGIANRIFGNPGNPPANPAIPGLSQGRFDVLFTDAKVINPDPRLYQNATGVARAFTTRLDVIDNLLQVRNAAGAVNGLPGVNISALPDQLDVDQITPIILRLCDQALISPEIINAIIENRAVIDNILNPLINTSSYDNAANGIAKLFELAGLVTPAQGVAAVDNNLAQLTNILNAPNNIINHIIDLNDNDINLLYDQNDIIPAAQSNEIQYGTITNPLPRLQIIHNILNVRAGNAQVHGMGNESLLLPIDDAQIRDIAPIILRLNNKALVTPRVINAIIGAYQEIHGLLERARRTPHFDEIATEIAEIFEVMRLAGVNDDLNNVKNFLRNVNQTIRTDDGLYQHILYDGGSRRTAAVINRISKTTPPPHGRADGPSRTSGPGTGIPPLPPPAPAALFEGLRQRVFLTPGEVSSLPRVAVVTDLNPALQQTEIVKYKPIVALGTIEDLRQKGVSVNELMNLENQFTKENIEGVAQAGKLDEAYRGAIQVIHDNFQTEVAVLQNYITDETNSREKKDAAIQMTQLITNKVATTITNLETQRLIDAKQGHVLQNLSPEYLRGMNGIGIKVHYHRDEITPNKLVFTIDGEANDFQIRGGAGDYRGFIITIDLEGLNPPHEEIIRRLRTRELFDERGELLPGFAITITDPKTKTKTEFKSGEIDISKKIGTNQTNFNCFKLFNTTQAERYIKSGARTVTM